MPLAGGWLLALELVGVPFYRRGRPATGSFPL